MYTPQKNDYTAMRDSCRIGHSIESCVCSGIENTRIFPTPNAIKQNESIRSLVLWLKLVTISDQITVATNISARPESRISVSKTHEAEQRNVCRQGHRAVIESKGLEMKCLRN